MNLKKLFIAQKELDEHIEKNHPRKEGEDRFGKLILALQVELAECAQESRCFKFWSSRQEPVTEDLRVVDYKESGEAILETYNPLLEEYVDCLHFILSIGNWLGFRYTKIYEYQCLNITNQFISIFSDVIELNFTVHDDWEIEEQAFSYEKLFRDFVGLGKMLGFTWEQIEQAYFAKNEENHKRQENGY